MWKIVQMETSNEKKLFGTYDLCRVNCKYFNNTCKYCGNTHEYWASTWKLCSTTASAIFASIITILVSVVEQKKNSRKYANWILRNEKTQLLIKHILAWKTYGQKCKALEEHLFENLDI